MTVYYLTITLLTGLGYIFTETKKSRKTTVLYLITAFLLLVFVSSCRYAIGFDYFSYRNIYETVSQWSFDTILHTYWGEPLYFVLCKLLSMTSCSYPVFLLIVNIFLMFVAIHFIYHHSKLPYVSVYLYITLQFLACNMNLIRQSIAVAFFLLAYPYLKDRKILPFTILILIGGLFHNSLLFLYPLYFLLPKKNTRKSLLLLTVFTLFTYIFFEPLFHLLKPFLPTKYVNYQGSYFWHANGFYYILFPALYCLLIYLFRNRIADLQFRSICLNSALYHFIISLFVTKHFILERFAIYPFIFALTAIPEILCSYKKDLPHDKTERERKPVLTYHRVLLLFLFFGGAYFFFAAFLRFHNVYPYVGLWDKSISSPN